MDGSWKEIENEILGYLAERGGVWPDSGFTVPLAKAEEQRWRAASFLTTTRMSSVVAEADTSAEPRDRALERAIQALRARDATTSSRNR